MSDRDRVQDAYEARLVELHALAIAKRYDEALAILDELAAAHGAHDHDGWLARSVLAHRALLLDERGDHDDAVSAQLDVLERSGPTELASEGLALAVYLEHAGHLEDAAHACEQAIAHAIGPAEPIALTLLARYAGIQARRGEAVPEHHRARLAAVAAGYGIDPPATGEPLAVAIARTRDTEHAAQQRYHAFRTELARLADEPARRAAIARYLATEPVAFYRRLAADL